ncbi:MAG: Hsp20/alpha crystallin family protein [Candidatus Kapaibacteriota bacterium]
MTMIKFDPFRGFDALTKKMNTLVNDLDKGFNFEMGNFSPRVDIIEDEKQLNFNFELAGVKKEDVKVTINDENVLIVKGQKYRENIDESVNENESENSPKYFIKVERNFGEFTRSFVLPDNVNKESISAKYENGILHLTFDKKEIEKPKVVEVEIN